VPDFIKIGQKVADIWRINVFQNGGRPPSWIFNMAAAWIFKNSKFLIVYPL